MTFRVMAGLTAIWAGNARELKDGRIAMTGTKYDVTDDVLLAATIWLFENEPEQEWHYESKSGVKFVLKVEREDVKE